MRLVVIALAVSTLVSLLATPLLIRPRQKGVEYEVEDHGDTLFIHTNDVSPQFRLVTAPISKPGEWTERIAPSASFYMTAVTTFADFFIVEGRDNGLDQIELHRYAGGTPKRIKFPEASYTASLDENPEYQIKTLRLAYESMVTHGLRVNVNHLIGAPGGYRGNVIM